jgi:UDP-glucose 4-epimerase
MKIIVFGGSGFIGSHICDELSDRGHEVTIFDTQKSKYLRSDQNMIIGDITNKEEIYEAVKGHDIIYNFAAVADIDEAMHKPEQTVVVNILGNVLLLEAAKDLGIKRFVYASTIYVYGKAGGFYRVSKQASEEYIESYHKYYGINYTILRYGTLYGPRSDTRNSVYRYLKSALINKKIVYCGDGNEKREYIHVRDAARLSVDILDEKYENEHIVVVGHNQMRVDDLFTMIKEILGGKIDIIYEGTKAQDTHYKMTPHSFYPTVAHKLVSHYYMDLGQGILNNIHEIYDELHISQETLD